MTVMADTDNVNTVCANGTAFFETAVRLSTV